MKQSILFSLAILIVALCSGCAKKQTVSENNPIDTGVTAQNQDFSNRKPFQFTITTNIDDVYVEDNGDDDEYDEDKSYIEISISINQVNDEYMVLYDLDCESDGDYEFTGLTDDHECVFERNTGEHKISVRVNIPGLFLCARHPVNEESCDTDEDNDVNFRCELSLNKDNTAKVVQSIDSWGDISWKSMFAFAADCEALESIPIEAPDLSHVSDMAHMFERAISFNQPIEKWDVSNVTNMDGMFEDAANFSHYPKSWIVPDGLCRNMFKGTKVENIAKRNPLKTENRFK